MEWQIASAGLLGLALILSVSIYGYSRLRIERERTLQKLMERGLSPDEFLRAAGVGPPRQSDLRRGVLLIGVGLTWSVATFFVGGPAWRMGGAPIAIGLVYVLLWALDGRSR
jgi:hypothetical protein